MSTPEEFAIQYGPLAVQTGRRLGVSPDILLGQWGLETGWGKSVIPGTNNLGNIKDFSGSGTMATDNATGSQDRYRAYENPQGFADDFSGLIMRKYPGAVGLGDDAEAFGAALKAGGYAEDPEYTSKLAGAAETLRKSPGLMERILNAVIPAANAGTLDDEWAVLEKKYSGQQQAQAAMTDDPWSALEQKYALPAADKPAEIQQQPSAADLPASAQDTPKPEPESGGYLPQIGSGLLEGVVGAMGAPVDLTNAALGLGMRGINAVFGTDLQPPQDPFGGSAWFRRGLPIAPKSTETGPQVARRVAQSVGGYLPFAGTARTTQQLAAGLGTAVGGGLGGTAAQQALPDSPTAEMLGEALGSIGTGATIAGVANRSARRAAEAAVPSVENLKSRAGDLYDEAERLGVTASKQQTQGLASDMHTIARQEGLISPTGRVSEAYPKAREALRMLDDYSEGTMSVPQMQTVRKVLSDAAGSTDNAERRIASIMLDRFDDFTAPLAPQLGEARMLYARALSGDQLETLRELAGSRAQQFTGSGYENALRTEYRQLNNRIIKDQERGWTPAQQEAISRVARGTAYGNAMRNLGKLAPTGVVSMGLGGGIPFMVGNAFGGPLLGSIAGAGAMGGGFLARDAATRATKRSAMLAEMLARSGGVLPASTNASLWPQMLGATLGGQAALQSGKEHPYLVP